MALPRKKSVYTTFPKVEQEIIMALPASSSVNKVAYVGACGALPAKSVCMVFMIMARAGRFPALKVAFVLGIFCFEG
jgi:hypothetical protein